MPLDLVLLRPHQVHRVFPTGSYFNFCTTGPLDQPNHDRIVAATRA